MWWLAWSRLYPFAYTFTLAGSGIEEGLQTLRHYLEPLVLSTLVQRGLKEPPLSKSTTSCSAVRGCWFSLSPCLEEPVSMQQYPL